MWAVGFEVHWRSTRAALALQLGLLRLDEGLHEAAPAGDLNYIPFN